MLRITSKNQFSTLVIGELTKSELSKATLKILRGAKILNKEVTLLLPESVSKVPKDYVNKVIVSPYYQTPDQMSNLVKQMINKFNFTHVVGSTSAGVKDFLPRVAVQYKCQPITDVIEIMSEDTFKRPIYAGNAIATVKSNDPIKFLSLRPTNFEQVECDGEVPVENIEIESCQQLIEHIKDEIQQNDKPELTSARIVVSGGRGLGSKENFKIIEDLADAFDNAAVGASRAAVDAGYVANDLQVGQTGKVVAPDLYIAIGISGAIQHLAGMKDSKTIVAINKDPEASIVQVADYTIVGDLFKVVPELKEKLKS